MEGAESTIVVGVNATCIGCIPKLELEILDNTIIRLILRATVCRKNELDKTYKDKFRIKEIKYIETDRLTEKMRLFLLTCVFDGCGISTTIRPKLFQEFNAPQYGISKKTRRKASPEVSVSQH